MVLAKFKFGDLNALHHRHACNKFKLARPRQSFLLYNNISSIVGMMSVLTVWRLASQPVFVTSLARPRVPMRCSGSSPATTLCLSGPTSEEPSGSTRRSSFRGSRMTLSHCTTSSRLVSGYKALYI